MWHTRVLTSHTKHTVILNEAIKKESITFDETTVTTQA